MDNNLLKAQDIAGIFRNRIVEDSTKYTYQCEDSYRFEFLIEVDKNVSEHELEQEIEDYYYRGPGAEYSKTNVSFYKKVGNKSIFKVCNTGGYDI